MTTNDLDVLQKTYGDLFTLIMERRSAPGTGRYTERPHLSTLSIPRRVEAVTNQLEVNKYARGREPAGPRLLLAGAMILELLADLRAEADGYELEWWEPRPMDGRAILLAVRYDAGSQAVAAALPSGNWVSVARVASNAIASTIPGLERVQWTAQNGATLRDVVVDELFYGYALGGHPVFLLAQTTEPVAYRAVQPSPAEHYPTTEPQEDAASLGLWKYLPNGRRYALTQWNGYAIAHQLDTPGLAYRLERDDLMETNAWEPVDVEAGMVGLEAVPAYAQAVRGAHDPDSIRHPAAVFKRRDEQLAAIMEGMESIHPAAARRVLEAVRAGYDATHVVNTAARL